MKTLRLILGDQLNTNHTWFKQPDDTVIYCLFEMLQETNYVTHHIQKVIEKHKHPELNLMNFYYD